MLALMALIGFTLGALGTLVGAGGGFILVPLLVLGFHFPPAQAAGTSLVMVSANSISGTISYFRQGKVDWKSGLLLAAIAYPGTILGARVGTRLPAKTFALIFGVVLIVLAIWMLLRIFRASPGRSVPEAGGETRAEDESAAAVDPAGYARRPQWWHLCRRLTERGGTVHEYCFIMPVGALIAFGVTFLGGMLGIGGGPLLVSGLILALHYPAHIATATSHFILAITSLGAAAVYLVDGQVLIGYAVALALGALAGAPLGAHLSRRINSRQLMLVVAALVGLLGVRLLI